MTSRMGAIEHVGHSHEGVGERVWGGFSDGEWGDCGVVVEHSFWFVQ